MSTTCSDIFTNGSGNSHDKTTVDLHYWQLQGGQTHNLTKGQDLHIFFGSLLVSICFETIFTSILSKHHCCGAIGLLKLFGVWTCFGFTPG